MVIKRQKDSVHDESVKSKSRLQILSFVIMRSYLSIIKHLREYGRQLTCWRFVDYCLPMKGKKIKPQHVKGKQNK